MRRREPSAMSEQTIDEASTWLVTMREPTVGERERAAFADWLRESPVNVRAYLEVAALWSDAAQLDPALTPGADAVRAQEISGTVHYLQDARHEALRSASEAQRRRRSVVLQTTGIAASALIAVVVAWWQLGRAPTYATAIGEQRAITLEDGSTVRLNSRTQIRVRLSDARRDVELLEGQALFEVSKDPRRPFVVDSGDASVLAVGTAFDVYRKTTGTVITVVEGRVLVNPAARSGDTSTAGASTSVQPQVALEAGEQATVLSTGHVAQARDVNVAAATGWLRHELTFADTALSAVIDEFNRYSPRPIVLVDPTLGEMRVNAVFHSTNPESLLLFVRRLEGVEIHESDAEIRIARRSAAP
jgi:transmembrane sensor